MTPRPNNPKIGAAPLPNAPDPSADLTPTPEALDAVAENVKRIRTHFVGVFGNFEFLRIRGRNKGFTFPDKSGTSFRLADCLIELGPVGSKYVMPCTVRGVVRANDPDNMEIDLAYPRSGRGSNSKAAIEGCDGAHDAMLDMYGHDVVLPEFFAWDTANGATAGAAPLVSTSGYKVPASRFGVEMPKPAAEATPPAK